MCVCVGVCVCVCVWVCVGGGVGGGVGIPSGQRCPSAYHIVSLPSKRLNLFSKLVRVQCPT